MYKNILARFMTEYRSSQIKNYFYYFFENDYEQLKFDFGTFKIDYCTINPSGTIENISVLENGGVVIVKDYYGFEFKSKNNDFYTFWPCLLEDSFALRDINCNLTFGFQNSNVPFTPFSFNLSNNLCFIKLVPDYMFEYNSAGTDILLKE